MFNVYATTTLQVHSIATWQ